MDIFNEYELDEIATKINNYIQSFNTTLFSVSDVNRIAIYTAQLMYAKVREKSMTIEESADVFQTLLAALNNPKYEPLQKIFAKIGGDYKDVSTY